MYNLIVYKLLYTFIFKNTIREISPYGNKINAREINNQNNFDCF